MISPDDLAKIMVIVTAAGVFFVLTALMKISVDLWPIISDSLGY